MSPRAERRPSWPARLLLRRAGGHAEAGFTLVEVIVSLGLFALITSATVPLLITGMRASLVAKLDTGAKNLSQERFEVMRNLPYHVDYDASNSPDLLDSYYRNASGTAACRAPGYVPAGAPRCTDDGDPATGAFYRYVVDPVPNFSKYSQYITTQFLTADRTPVTPDATYDSQVAGFDVPAASLVGVNVTTVWTAGQVSKKLKIYSQIQDGRPAAPQVTAQARSSALKLSSHLDPSTQLLLEAGLVNLDGALSTGATAAASALGAYSALSPGTRLEGALRTAAAPPNVGAGSASAGASGVTDNSTYWARYAGTSVGNVGAAVTGGDPVIGSSSSPVTARVNAAGVGGYSIRYHNAPAASDHLMLRTDRPVAFITDAAAAAQGTGYVTSVPGASHQVTSGAGASTSVLHLLPTAFAPDGVITLRLTSSSLVCVANGSSTASATPTYTATVEYWDLAIAGYRTVTWTYGASEPLADVPLNTVVGVDLSGLPIYLGEYISGWAGLTTATAAPSIEIALDSNAVQANLEGLVSLTTQPLRPGDETSAVSVQLGLLSCVAEDNR